MSDEELMDWVRTRNDKVKGRTLAARAEHMQAMYERGEIQSFEGMTEEQIYEELKTALPDDPDTTDYLLSNEANATSLRKSIEQYRAGKTIIGPKALDANDMEDYLIMAERDDGSIDYEYLARRINQVFGFWQVDDLIALAHRHERSRKRRARNLSPEEEAAMLDSIAAQLRSRDNPEQSGDNA